MDYKDDNLDELLDYIDPAAMTYQEWCGVGMALKDSGYDCSLWDSWSQRDTVRYHSGECEKKWRSFAGSEHPVTAGTIVHMALENGYRPQSAPKESRALSWDDYIGEDYVVTSRKEAQDIPVAEPQAWNPAQELSRYIETLFEAEDFVGYVMETWQNKDGKYLPTSGCCDRTAGQLLEALGKCGGDIGAVVGDYAEEAGAWIRFNPLDGKGGKNENVTEYRYALVESDVLDVERQNIEVTTAEGQMLDGQIGYIRISSFKGNTPEQFQAIYDRLVQDGAKALIFDLRDDGGGLVSALEKILDPLLPEGEIAIATYRDGTTKTLVESDATECSLPMTVIVNGNTASAAELFTASLRDFGKASVVGTQTFGKGIMQVTQSMPSGGALTLTVATYQTTKGECYHKVGIKPDEIVEAGEDAVDYSDPNPEKDPQLKKAIEMVQAK